MSRKKAAKNLNELPDSEEQQEQPKLLPKRLCTEIKLFDLCDIDFCDKKDGKFCTDPQMVSRFEAETEPEDRPKWHFDSNGADQDLDDEDENPYLDEYDDEEDDGYSLFDENYDDNEQDDEW